MTSIHLKNRIGGSTDTVKAVWLLGSQGSPIEIAEIHTKKDGLIWANVSTPANAVAPKLAYDLATLTYTITPGVWSGEQPITLSYNKVVDGVFGIAITGSTFSALPGEDGKTIQIQENALNINGGSVKLSNAIVQTKAPAVTTAPVLSLANDVYTVAPGVWTGVPIPAITRYVVIDGVQGSALVGTTFNLNAANAGKSISVREMAVNTALTVYSNSNIIIQPAAAAGAPQIATMPTLSYNANTGIFTVVPGTWTGTPTPTVTRNPQIDLVNQADLAGLSFTIANLVENQEVRVREAATNSNGVAAVYTNTIKMSSLANLTNAPYAYGSLKVGGVHTGVQGGWNAATAIQEQWLMDGVVVATTPTYTPIATGSLVYQTRAKGSGGVWTNWQSAPTLTISTSQVLFTVAPQIAPQVSQVQVVGGTNTISVTALPTDFVMAVVAGTNTITINGVPPA